MAGGTKPTSGDVDAAIASSAAGVHRFDLTNTLLKSLLSWLGLLAAKDTLAPGDLAAGTPDTLLGYGGGGAGSGVTVGSGLALTGGTLSAAGGVPTSRQVATASSVQGGGDLTANRTLSLVGDTATPGATKLYGTDGAGARGWQAQPASATFPTVSALSGDWLGDAVTRTLTGALATLTPGGSPPPPPPGPAPAVHFDAATPTIDAATPTWDHA